MFYDKEKINISILFHGVEYSHHKAQINKEMFIDLNEIEKLILFLKQKKFEFISCNEVINHNKTCSISFDDGYSGVKFFDEFSKKYSIPYTLFLNSYNILYNKPFIWDLYKLQFGKNYNFLSDYKDQYNQIDQKTFSILKEKKIYMPLNKENIIDLDKNPNIKLSLHTHYHQVLMGNHFKKYNEEINNNIDFLNNFNQADTKSIALPCGFYDTKLINKLSEDFSKIFTIDGGTSKNTKLVNRISLINSSKFSLLDQIEYFLSYKFMIKRYLVNKKYSFLSNMKIN